MDRRGGATGCTVVIPPPGSRGGVDVRGGGPGTRETDNIGPLAGTSEVSAVALCGGSAFGLAAADGVGRWLEEHEMGYRTPAGLVPIVPRGGRLRPRRGRSARAAGCRRWIRGMRGRGAGCARARARRRRNGSGRGKILGREYSTPAGIGFAAARSGAGETVAALAVVNAFGDVIGEDGPCWGVQGRTATSR